MITKGIVEKVIDQYSVKVRLPLYDGAKIGTICVDTGDLSNATICTVSGMVPALKVGDVVFVGFEDNDRGKPVVLGYLYNEFSSGSFVDLTLNSLRVNVGTELPIDTSIGKVGSEEIQSLLGVRGNIQGQLDLISSQMDASKLSYMTNPMTTAGDIIYGGASGAATRLAKGTARQVLKMNANATAPAWTSQGGTMFRGNAMSYYDGYYLLTSTPSGLGTGDFYLTTSGDPNGSTFSANDLFIIDSFNSEFNTYEATRIGHIGS